MTGQPIDIFDSELSISQFGEACKIIGAAVELFLVISPWLDLVA